MFLNGDEIQPDEEPPVRVEDSQPEDVVSVEGQGLFVADGDTENLPTGEPVYDPVDDYPERPLEEALSHPERARLIDEGLAEGTVGDDGTVSDFRITAPFSVLPR